MWHEGHQTWYTQVHEYDCLLLEHVFGQRPDDAHKVRAWVLDTIASDPGLQQTELVFLGLFGRACRVLEGRDAQARTPAAEALLGILALCLGHLTDLPALLSSAWPLPWACSLRALSPWCVSRTHVATTVLLCPTWLPTRGCLRHAVCRDGRHTRGSDLSLA